MAPKRDVEGMGPPEIKYGESLCFVQHVASGLWLTYAAPDPKALRLGVLKKKVGTGKERKETGWGRGSCLSLQNIRCLKMRERGRLREKQKLSEEKNEEKYMLLIHVEKRERNIDTGKGIDKYNVETEK